MKTIQALSRQTGLYGTVNEGDTVTVSPDLADELVALGNFKHVSDEAPTATPDQEVARNESGISADGAVHKDATEAEVRNDEARALADPTPSEIADAKTDAQVAVLDEVKEKEDKGEKLTKEDKAAKGRSSK